MKAIFQTQSFLSGLKTETIFRDNFFLDYPSVEEYFSNCHFPSQLNKPNHLTFSLLESKVSMSFRKVQTRSLQRGSFFLLWGLFLFLVRRNIARRSVHLRHAINLLAHC